MRINNLEYAKTVKALALLDELASESAGTFFEKRLAEFRGRLLIAAANRWSAAIQTTKPNRPTTFIIEKDVVLLEKNGCMIDEKEAIDAIIEKVKTKFRRVELDEVRQTVWYAWLSVGRSTAEAEKFACTLLRKQTAQVKALFNVNADALGVEANPENDVSDTVRRATINTLDKLDDIDKQIFRERFVLGKTLLETASHIGRCQSTVCYRLKKIAKIFLREYGKYDNR